MNNEDIVRMVNQIAAYFAAYPRNEAIDGIAGHIRNAWTPRMRQQLADYIEAGAENLSPLAVAALAPKAKARS